MIVKLTPTNCSISWVIYVVTTLSHYTPCVHTTVNLLSSCFCCQHSHVVFDIYLPKKSNFFQWSIEWFFFTKIHYEFCTFASATCHATCCHILTITYSRMLRLPSAVNRSPVKLEWQLLTGDRLCRVYACRVHILLPTLISCRKSTTK